MLYLAGGTLSINGAISNSGLVKLSGTASLAVTGTFTNTGILDLINGPQALPAHFINNGIVLNSDSVKVQQTARSGSTFTVMIEGYAQHTYQLQRASSVVPPITWANIGLAQSGTGSQLVFTDTSASGAQGFYRMQVSP